MGYVREKYTREYFLCQTGKPGVGADGIEYFNKGVPHPRIVKALDIVGVKGKRVLDIGFGRGEAMKYALEQGASFVLGVDFSSAALHIARQYLVDYILREPHRLRLVCSDLLTVLQGDHFKGYAPFDVICMFDVLEHIPRHEVDPILSKLMEIFAPDGNVIITTPFYKVDCDVISEGVKPGADDSSDRFPETQGMHCNRYTRGSLRSTLSAFGLSPADDLLTIWYKP